MVWERLSDPDKKHPWQELPVYDAAGIDIRQTITNCVRDHGHEVFLRSPTDQKCPCAETTGPFKEFDPRCSTCNGFGFIYVDTKIRTYRRPAFGTFGFTGGTMRQEIGVFGAADLVFYFQHTARSVVGHHILEVTTDDAGLATKPYQIERTHEILLAHLYRERVGRPEYWAVLTRDRRINK
jgi:hypothetical protein